MAFYLKFYGLAVTCILALTTLVEARSKCLNPSVRREWWSLSEIERENYMDALKCLAKLPHNKALTPTVAANLSQIPPINSSSSAYDDFVYVHMDLNTIIHYTGLFLPWHRLYVHALEQAMKTSCNYQGTQPYWDWTKDSPDFEHAKIFGASPTTGFGGWGDPNNDLQISTGALADIIRSYPSPHHIRRNFTLRPYEFVGSPFPDNQSFIDPMTMANLSFTPSNIEYMVDSFRGDFLGFHAYMEGAPGPHGGIHQIISADMIGTCPANAGPDCVWGAKWTPNDALFFMHHAMIDKVWYDWQHKYPENFWSYVGGTVATLGTSAPVTYAQYTEFPNGAPPMKNLSSVLPGDGIFEDRVVYDVMDPQGDFLCYKYE